MQKQPVVIILASTSPRRRQLLEAAGVAFDVLSTDVDESAVRAEHPAQLVTERARLKAEAVAASLRPGGEKALVVGADTVVVLDDEVLGKPEDEADARRMLARLSGRNHHVLTGLAVCPVGLEPPAPVAAADTGAAKAGIARPNGRCVVAFQTTEVTMGALSPETIARYVATGEPLDKAGAYGIQERGGLLVRRIEGDYFNVVGLPLALLRDMTSVFGVDLLEQGQQ